MTSADMLKTPAPEVAPETEPAAPGKPTAPQAAPTVFAALRTAAELKLYLDDATRRLDNSKYLYHYTTLPSVLAMLRSRTWHLANATEMNDQLEFGHGDPKRWRDLFFSCFMAEDKESIAMWSMYAQPWVQGVKVAIPKTELRRWLREAKVLQEISTVDYQPTGRIIQIGEKGASLWLSAVAYTNAESLQDDEPEKLTWSNQSNTLIQGAVRDPELTGYIKDMAWSYEKEIRIKASFDNQDGFRRVAIALPDDLLQAITFTASPLFKGNLRDMLARVVDYEPKTDASMFAGRLNIRSVCPHCEAT